jgi:hypothetical protein
VRGSGVAGTSSALFWREQTFGIDLSLERRPEGLPGGSGRFARVVGRVESVCTNPAAKGPTGPFFLVHLQMLPRCGGCVGGRPELRSCPAGSVSVPAVAELVLSRFAVLPDPRVGPGQKAVARTT